MKADLFEGRTFLVEVEGGDREQAVLPLVFCKDLLGEKLFRDSGRMRSQSWPHSPPLKKMFNDMSQTHTSLDSYLCPL